MRYLLTTDTHLGIYGDSEAWHTVVLNLFEEICYTCKMKGIDQIIHLGDFFHNRKAINTKTQSVAHKIATMLGDFHIYIVVGNHDCYYRNTIIPNSLQFLNNYENITIVDIPLEVDGDIILVPWGWHSIKSPHKYLMGHLQVSGFHMNDNYICKEGQDPESLKEFKQVLLGHFHTPSQQGNITYIGAPYQQTFNDCSGARGYYIWEDGKLSFIQNTNSPEFIKMSTNDIKESIIPGNIVKLLFDKDYGTIENEKIVDRVMKKNPFKLHVNFAEISYIDEDEQIEQDITLLDHDGIIKEYVMKKCTPPENIKKNTLLDIIMKLTGEIKNEG